MIKDQNWKQKIWKIISISVDCSMIKKNDLMFNNECCEMIKLEHHYENRQVMLL